MFINKKENLLMDKGSNRKLIRGTNAVLARSC